MSILVVLTKEINLTYFNLYVIMCFEVLLESISVSPRLFSFLQVYRPRYHF